MGLELQLEDVLLVDAVRLFRGADRVAEQGEAGQREVVLQASWKTALSEYRPAHVTVLNVCALVEIILLC